MPDSRVGRRGRARSAGREAARLSRRNAGVLAGRIGAVPAPGGGTPPIRRAGRPRYPSRRTFAVAGSLRSFRHGT